MCSPDASDAVDIAVAVVQHRGRLLIGTRPTGAPLAGMCEFPGGKIQTARGESPSDAAARECLEETGLQVRVDQPYPTVIHAYDHAVVRLHFFACSVCEPATPRQPFRWLPVEELDERRFPAANAELIRGLRASGGFLGVRRAQPQAPMS